MNKIVQFWLSLVWGRCFEEILILIWVLVTKHHLIELFLACKQISIRLEQTLLSVVEYRHADRLHLQSESKQQIRLGVVALLQCSCLFIALCWILEEVVAGLFALLICVNLVPTLAPAQEGIKHALQSEERTSFDLILRVSNDIGAIYYFRNEKYTNNHN